MSNPWGRSGAPMIQPKKDDFRQWLAEAQAALKQERKAHSADKYRLDLARRKLGELVLAGTLPVAVERLGDIVIDAAMDEDLERISKQATETAEVES